MKSKVKLERRKAFFVQQPNGLYQPLDLKQRKISFLTDDVKACEKVMQREKQTLKYSCRLRIPTVGEHGRTDETT